MKKVKNLSMFFIQMKKKIIVLLSLAIILLTWCNNSKPTEIDPSQRKSSEWILVEKVFDNQIEESQYIQDLEDLISYDILLVTEDKPFISDISLVANFDAQSSVQWWLSFFQKKYSKSHELENREINFDIRAEESQDDSQPFYASWNLSLVYQNNEMYAKIHNFWVYMWEWNMLAKMYSLLWESLIDKWIDLEVNNNWIISINEKEEIKLQHILWTLKNVLKSEWVNDSSSNFLNDISELIDTVNSYIDLWISTNGLSLQSLDDIKYYELKNWIIQKDFIWKFKWEESAFDIYFITSKQWLQVHFYNIKSYDEDIMDYKEIDREVLFSIQESGKSNYSIKLQLIQSRQIIVNLDWNLKYNNGAKLSGKFILEPLELVQWQKISWNIEWKIIKTSANENEIFQEVLWETISLTDILSSL